MTRKEGFTIRIEPGDGRNSGWDSLCTDYLERENEGDERFHQGRSFYWLVCFAEYQGIELGFDRKEGNL